MENNLNIIVPKVYKELLQTYNGLETKNGICIYGTEDIVERNETLEVKEYASGYIAIGDDSGDNVFLMKSDFGELKVFSVDCGYMNPENAELITENLMFWITNGAEIKQKVYKNKFYNIELVEMPESGIKDLFKIKKILKIDCIIGELTELTKKLPFILKENVSEIEIIENRNILGELNKYLKITEAK